ncbi:uncharacterized protein LOC117790222 [Drosophila innubila]|uniref:uncharacterized protein LOC117790222 n=1 Tax=Drosophila innubila TaxID=198719 RepID=UPI00148CE272|nr:uncharacterized protein LOC117790222 [Drosophila innubila]
MEMKLFIVLLLRIFWMHSVQSFDIALPPNFNCHRDVPSQPLNLKALAGVWYEVGRVPSGDVLRCLNVTVPDKAESELVLDLEYISSYDGSLSPVKQTVSFPWDSNTQNSIFNLYYGEIANNPSVTYKVMYTDYRRLTLICGYSGISPIPLAKLLSRQRQLDKKLYDIIQAAVDKSPFREYYVWSEQTKCNAADRSVAGTISTIALVILWMLSKWC